MNASLRARTFPLIIVLSLLAWEAKAQFGTEQLVEFSFAQSMYFLDQGDIDGDGDIDLLVRTSADATWWLPNAGDGRYLPLQLMLQNTHYAGPLMDLDEDGDLDYVFTQLNGTISWLQNSGDGTFAPTAPLQTVANARRLHPADIDQDGDTDLVVWAETTTTLMVVWNLGQGVLSAPLILDTNVSYLRNVEVVDLDGDGALDVVVGAFGIYWYRSLGATFDARQTIPSNTSIFYYVTCADIDNDGDVDIVSHKSTDWMQKHINQGGGVFSAEEELWANVQYREVHLVDMDQDDDLDILYATSFRVGWMRGQGDGDFIAQTELSLVGASHVDLVDVTGDGLPDLVDGTFEHLKMHRAQGGGVFAAPRTIAKDVREYSRVACGDLDGDGDRDIVATVRNEDRLVWFRNDGEGGFGLEDTLCQTAYQASNLRIADLNGDGRNDVIFMQDGLNNLAWCMNEGDGTFGDPQVITNAGIPDLMDFAVLDMDGDGDLDIAGPNGASQVAWQLNDGTGTFTPGAVLASGFPRTFDVLDLDEDGDQDLLFSNSSNVYLFLNEGGGAFTMALDMPVTIGAVFSVRAGDLDDDGLKDILAVGSTGHRHWRNMGDNSFTAGTYILSMDVYTDCLQMADMDLDGLVDLVGSGDFVGTSYFHLRVRHKVIGPRFTQEPVVATGFLGAGMDTWVVTADLDNDGDLDLVTSSPANGKLACYKNYVNSPYRLAGSVFHDVDADGLRDAGEPGLPLVPVNITPATAYRFTSSTGTFLANVPPGDYEVTVVPPSPTWTPTTPLPLAFTLNEATPLAENIAIGLTLPDTTVLDPSIVLMPAVCSDTTTIWASVRSFGKPVGTGQLVLELDTLLTYVSATPPPAYQSGTTVAWNFTNLATMATANMQVRVIMPPATAMPHDMVLSLTATTPQSTTTFVDTLHRPLVCSYDPNDKLVDPVGYGFNGVVPISTPSIEYTIRFQNTGNAPAETVQLLDEIDLDLDPLSIVPLAWSHPISTLTVDNNRRVFARFDEIMLPDSASDPIGSQGFLRFRITPESVPTPNHTQAENTAAIFFDLNEPVITNTARTFWYDCTGYVPWIGLVNDTTLVTDEGDSMQWYLNGEPLVGATGDSLVIPGPGVYTVLVLNGVGCLGFSAAYAHLVSGQAEAPAWARVWPTPAADVLHVVLTEGLVDCIGLSDGLGRMVVPCSPVPVTAQRLNVGQLEPGPYFLHGRSSAGAALPPIPVLVVR